MIGGGNQQLTNGAKVGGGGSDQQQMRCWEMIGEFTPVENYRGREE